MTGRYGLKSVPLQEREDEADVGSVVALLQRVSNVKRNFRMRADGGFFTGDGFGVLQRDVVSIDRIVHDGGGLARPQKIWKWEGRDVEYKDTEG